MAAGREEPAAMTGIAAARSVTVAMISPREELMAVLRGAVAIGIAVWVYLALTVGFVRDSSSVSNLLPFQRLAADRPAADQRMFRELQEGLIEAENARGATGRWPEVSKLASDGIPPFAPTPTSTGPSYTWRLLRSGAYVNYLGLPDRPDAPAWLVWIQEPQPGVPVGVVRESQEHHRLSDGSMLRVSTWTHTNGGSLQAQPIVMPQSEGWLQLFAVEPS
jgi:hypothetical protein